MGLTADIWGSQWSSGCCFFPFYCTWPGTRSTFLSETQSPQHLSQSVHLACWRNKPVTSKAKTMWTDTTYKYKFYHCCVNFSPSSSTIPGGGWLDWTGTLVTERTKQNKFILTNKNVDSAFWFMLTAKQKNSMVSLHWVNQLYDCHTPQAVH